MQLLIYAGMLVALAVGLKFASGYSGSSKGSSIQNFKESVPKDKSFYFCNGKSARSLVEFLNILESLTTEEFKHHVNKERHDFANWIRNAVGNKKIADHIEKTENKEKMVKKLKNKL